MFKKVAFTMYPATDVPRARRSYEEVFGLVPGSKGERGGIRWVEYDLSGSGCFAITNATQAQPSATAGGTVAFEVEELDALIADLKAKNVEFKGDVIHSPVCRMAVCVDGEGNSVLLQQRKPKNSEPHPRSGPVYRASISTDNQGNHMASLTKPLAVETPSDREIVVTRIFNAPRRLVWDCHTKPELLRRWLLGPEGWSMPVCEVDLRVGGKYHYRWRNDADGREFGFNGIHREIEAPVRIVTIQRPDGAEGEALNTLVLTEQNGKTTLSLTMLFATKEARDGALATGMTGGMETSYQRLDQIAASTA